MLWQGGWCKLRGSPSPALENCWIYSCHLMQLERFSQCSNSRATIFLTEERRTNCPGLGEWHPSPFLLWGKNYFEGNLHDRGIKFELNKQYTRVEGLSLLSSLPFPARSEVAGSQMCSMDQNESSLFLPPLAIAIKKVPTLCMRLSLTCTSSIFIC